MSSDTRQESFQTTVRIAEQYVGDLSLFTMHLETYTGSHAQPTASSCQVSENGTAMEFLLSAFTFTLPLLCAIGLSALTVARLLQSPALRRARDR